MNETGLLDITPLSNHWPTLDPFLFCAYHNDAYPDGDDDMAPATSLAGRAIGQDFSGRDGWSMYHGDRVPGFPQHPHRGFETVTVARHGFIDHADYMGACARFGEGDLQWMTAVRGIVHSEMFPLRQRTGGNHTELFQIWLNLPARNKMVGSHFAMVWAADAQVDFRNGGEEAEILLLQGRPINEPVAHHGPFVMNSRAELQQAFMDYQRTEFGGWQWPSHGPVHPRDSGRFAKFADGRVENGAAGEET